MLISPLKSNGQQHFSSVTEYLRSLDGTGVANIKKSIDEFILSIDDIEQQSKVAALCFDYYYNSNYMGNEAIALHIADNYFLNNKLQWIDNEGFMMLQLFAEFNRRSMVGNLAPELILENNFGGYISTYGIDTKPYGLKILYFYDANCITCKSETPKLVQFLKEYSDSDLTFYAIYTQSDKSEWSDYIAKHFDNINNPKVDIVHLWDPEVESEFHKEYGVLTTPALFAIDNSNTIVGRKLNGDVIKQIIELSHLNTSDNYYFFEELFQSANNEEDILSIINSLEVISEEDDGAFRSIFFDLYNFLKESDSPLLKESAYFISQKYILGNEQFWSHNFVDDCKSELYFYEKTEDKNPSNRTILYFYRLNEKMLLFAKQLEDLSDSLKSSRAKVIVDSLIKGIKDLNIQN